MNILFLGFGDLASRCAQLLDEYTLYAVSRSVKPVPEGVTFVQGSVLDANLLEWLGERHWDVVIITFTPSSREESAYRQAYVETCQHLARLWGADGKVHRDKPGHIIYVSSSSVYAQDDGTWVDEQSPALAASVSGQCLREAESIIANMGLPFSVVRFAGIYGPGRDFVVRQVLAGQSGGEAMTNRIHQDDCAGFLAHLVRRLSANEPIETLYLATDSMPCSSREVRDWIASYLNVTLQFESKSGRGGNKRCDNRKMLSSGYCLLYPSYKEGYSPMLDALKAKIKLMN